jgi:predicted DNA-binding transcriptional regulator AlpA
MLRIQIGKRFAVFLETREVADTCSMSESAVVRQITRKQLPATRLPYSRVWLICHTDYIAWREKRDSARAYGKMLRKHFPRRGYYERDGAYA